MTGTLVVEGLQPVRTRKYCEELAGFAQGVPVSVGVTNAGVFADEAAVASFTQAVEKSRALQHPTIAATLGINPAGPLRCAIAWRRVDGPRLDEVLSSRGPFMPDEAVAMVATLAEAVSYAHEHGVVHGDLDSSWVTVARDGSGVKLAGFGPGLLTGKASISGDVAALGALLHELLTGERPGSELATLPPSALHLSLVINRALGLSGAARLETVSQFERALGEANRTRVSGGVVLPATAQRSATTLRTLGPWQLDELLGEGAMGQVFKARHSLLGRQAAIKVLRPEQYQRDDLIQRFFQEARAVNQINHEHIVEISDFGQETGPDGRPQAVYFVMELLQGHTLTERLARGQFTIEKSLHIVRQLASALAAAHRLGVVHRDVKTDNVFLTARGGDNEYVKVLDFGVAKLTQPGGDAPVVSTMDGAIIGTPTSMSPEQASGGAVDQRADIYAVGVVLYQLLSGRLPIDAENFGKLVALLLTKPPPPLPETTPLGEAIPPGLAAVVMRCLEKDPDKRPQSMNELILELSSPQRVSARPRRRGAVVAGLAVLLAGLAAGGWWWSTHAVVQPLPAEVDAGAVAVVVQVPDAAVETPFDAGVTEEEPDAGAVEAAAPADAGKATVKVKPPKPVELTPQVAQRAIARGKPKVDDCLFRYRPSLPAGAGAITVKWTVELSGAVSHVSVVSGAPPNSVVAKCVVKAVQSFDFPRHVGPARSVTLPFTWSAQ